MVSTACGSSANPALWEAHIDPDGSVEVDAEPPDTSPDDGGDLEDAADGSPLDADNGAPIEVDPREDGPYGFAEIDDATTSTSGNQVPIHAAYPTDGPSPGPYPVVIVAHGFQLPPSQYYGYVRRLASFGYVALTADYPAGFTGVSHAKNALDLSSALDWALLATSKVGHPLEGKVSATQAGVTGHSLGGKLSVLAAASDTRFRAVLALDPVDSSLLCSPQDCPTAKEKLPLPIPTAFLGELLDSTGGIGGQACAPAADNFETFFARASSPSFRVTVHGANHMSFLDDPNCGLVCSACKPATVPHAPVVGLARAYMVAFFERYLRGDKAYDSWLSGDAAQAEWVQGGLAAIAIK